uniref:C-type lectin domain family 17, member A n=1 Tax=Jaculus jaculus TaxID=51337 RepID=UPI001E1B5648|nr:C-type lectin domain family 17, member A [Jaculus jaculus]
MPTLYVNAADPQPPGTTEEEEEDNDYENSTPSYKDLPPKPGWMAPPRPPRAGKNAETPPVPRRPQKMTAAPVPWIHRRSRACAWWPDERLAGLVCLLGMTSLILSCLALAVTLTKYREVTEALRTLTVQQAAWQANVSGMAGLAGLQQDMDWLRSDTEHALAELRSLLGRRLTCPHGWLPFENKCYYFSPSTKSWDEARIFCQESYSHLVIIDSFEEHNFVANAHGSPRVYWLGLSDKQREGDWRWLDGAPVTLSFWDPQEPNNLHGEDCASMNRGGTWNDLSCAKTTYWICERECSC